jgi:transcriptional regulator with XRE-family HTH domain
MSGIKSSKNHIAISPGETIKEILKDRGISQKELALRTGYTEKHISRLLNGLVLLTPNVATALEYALNIK